MKKRYVVLASIALAVFPLKYALFDNGDLSSLEAPYQFTNEYLDTIRAEMASEPTDELPIELREVTVAKGVFPSWFRVAGQTTRTDFEFVTYQLMFDDRYFIIDPAHDAAMHDEIIWKDDYYQEAYSETQKTLPGSHKIFFTHEHGDHCAGAFRTPLFDSIKDKIFLTTEQKNSFLFPYGLQSPDQADDIEAVSYERHKKLGPGVYAIKTPGHTEGSQSIFIRLQSGKEILLVGDIAYSFDNISKGIGKPLIASLIILGEQNQLVNEQIKGLSELSKSTPALSIIPAHDIDYNDKLREQGVLKTGLK